MAVIPGQVTALSLCFACCPADGDGERNGRVPTEHYLSMLCQGPPPSPSVTTFLKGAWLHGQGGGSGRVPTE